MNTSQKVPNLKVGDSIGFEKEYKYLGMCPEPPHERKYSYIPITGVTNEGIELTEIKYPYRPNVFVLPWDEFERYFKEGKYKIKRASVK